MDREFTIGDRQFTLNKINAMRQFHIVRRLAPVLGAFLPLAKKFSKMKDDELQEDQLEALKPIMDGISSLSDADANIVLYGLLSCVEVKQPQTGNWAKIANESGIMMQDLELPVLLQAAGRAFMFNMTGFFSVLPQVTK